MEIVKGEESTRVSLVAGDDLAAVPRGYKKLLSAPIQSWRGDPRAPMLQIAEQALGPNMQAWFRTMAERGDWSLNLHKTTYGLDRAGFAFSAPDLQGAEVGPPTGEALPESFPQELADFYGLVGYVDWSGFGNAGGLETANNHARMTSYAYLCEGRDLDPAETFIFGWGASGDMLFYTTGGRTGWLSHETGEIQFFDGVEEALEWVFGELLAGRCPGN